MNTAFNLGQVALTGGNVHLNCSTATNWTYQLQYRDNLDSSLQWFNLAPAMSGTGGAIWLSDPDGATNAMRFSRVQAR